MAHASQKNDLAESTQFMTRITAAHNAGNVRKSTLQGLMEVIGRGSISQKRSGRVESQLKIRSNVSRKPTVWSFAFEKK